MPEPSPVPARLGVALLLTCLALPAAALSLQAPAEVTLEQVRQCKTPQEVRQLMGRPPDRVARQIFYQGRVEQWVYDRPLPCRVELLYRLGEEPRVKGARTRHPTDR